MPVICYLGNPVQALCLSAPDPLARDSSTYLPQFCREKPEVLSQEKLYLYVYALTYLSVLRLS